MRIRQLFTEVSGRWVLRSSHPKLRIAREQAGETSGSIGSQISMVKCYHPEPTRLFQEAVLR